MQKIHSLFFLCLVATLALASCKEDPDPNVITEDYYFQADLDGETVTYQDGLDDYTNIVGDFYADTASNGIAYAPFTCIAKTAAATNPIPSLLAKSGAVSVVATSANELTTMDAYAQLVSTGTLSIGKLPRSSTETAVPGAFISVFDADGTEWNTNNGPLGNGSVVITEYTTSVDNNRIPATQRIVAATFSATVYNSAGASKELTNGKIRGRLIIWN